MKKYFNILLLFIIIFIFPNFIYANTDYIKESSQILNKMKIIIGDENGDLMLNDSLTRAQFATIIVRLIQKENDPPPITTIQFDDFDKSFWGYSYIYKCVNEGYLIGDGNGKFRPNDIIKYEEACTIMLRILNKENGLISWPNDYISKSEELGINKNCILKKGDIVSRGNACILIYNCLNISI